MYWPFQDRWLVTHRAKFLCLGLKTVFWNTIVSFVTLISHIPQQYFLLQIIVFLPIYLKKCDGVLLIYPQPVYSALTQDRTHKKSLSFVNALRTSSGYISNPYTKQRWGRLALVCRKLAPKQLNCGRRTIWVSANLKKY